MRPCLTAMIVVLAFATLASADDWKKTYQVTGTPDVLVTSGDGNIRVAAAATREVRAEVITEGWRIGPNDVRIEEHQTGNRVEIRIHIPRVHFQFGHRSLRVELTVPHESNLDLQTSDGNITAESVKGQLHFATGDGNIDGRSLDGALRASSGDGHIRLLGRFDQLDLHTGDGNIDAEVQPGSKMTASWLVRTGDGSVVLHLPEGFGADLDVRTGDGRISVDVPVTTSGSFERSRLRGKLNGGGMLLELRSGDGNISIRKS